MTIALTSFLVVLLAEIGDKTQLLSLCLVARFQKPWPVLAAVFAATLLNHAASSYIGVLIGNHLDERILGLAVGISLLAMAFWALKPDKLDCPVKPNRFGPFLTSLGLFFLAEIGDKTQAATVALAAQYRSVLWVTVGTTVGMMAANAPVIFLGEWLQRKIPLTLMRGAAAVLFAVLGIITLWRTY